MVTYRMRRNSSDLGVADKLVIAAATLGEGGGSFTAEDLVVAAWERFPETFGLRGHLDDRGRPLYPDSNRVFAEIMGTKPVRKRGWIEKVGNKRYRISDVGRQRASEVHGGSSAHKLVLDRGATDRIGRLLKSRAMIKLREGRSEEITFLDACFLWGINPRSNLNELTVKFGDFDHLLKAVEQSVPNGGFVLRHGDVPYTIADVRTLHRLSEDLRERFASEIETIKSRRTERGGHAAPS